MALLYILFGLFLFISFLLLDFVSCISIYKDFSFGLTHIPYLSVFSTSISTDSRFIFLFFPNFLNWILIPLTFSLFFFNANVFDGNESENLEWAIS